MKVCRGIRVTEGLENAWVGKASTTSTSCPCQRKGLGLIWLQSRKFKYSLQGTFLSKDCSCLAHKGIMRVWKLEFSNQFSLHRSLWLTRAQILLCRAVPRADRFSMCWWPPQMSLACPCAPAKVTGSTSSGTSSEGTTQTGHRPPKRLQSPACAQTPAQGGATAVIVCAASMPRALMTWPRWI